MGDRIRLWKIYSRKQLEEAAKKAHKDEIEWRKQKEYMQKLHQQRGKQSTDSYVDEIQIRFARGENISGLIRETLLRREGDLPARPMTLLQNTDTPTVCYMNYILQ